MSKELLLLPIPSTDGSPLLLQGDKLLILNEQHSEVRWKRAAGRKLFYNELRHELQAVAAQDLRNESTWCCGISCRIPDGNLPYIDTRFMLGSHNKEGVLMILDDHELSPYVDTCFGVFSFCKEPSFDLQQSFTLFVKWSFTLKTPSTGPDFIGLNIHKAHGSIFGSFIPTSIKLL